MSSHDINKGGEGKSSQQSSKASNKVTSEAFDYLMKLIDPDPEKAGQEYAQLVNTLIRYFSLRGHSNCRVAAEETLDKMALYLFRDKTQVTNLLFYSLGFARRVSQERLRRQARYLVAEQGFSSEDTERVVNETTAYLLRGMGDCLQQLPPEDRELLESYYADKPPHERTAHREQLARQQGLTIDGLRTKIARLRGKLRKIWEENKKNQHNS